jgi:hypothetical protein
METYDIMTQYVLRNNFWMSQAILMKPCMRIMAHKPTSRAYYVNPLCQSVGMRICVHLQLGNGYVKALQAEMNMKANIK